MGMCFSIDDYFSLLLFRNVTRYANTLLSFYLTDYSEISEISFETTLSYNKRYNTHALNIHTGSPRLSRVAVHGNILCLILPFATYSP